MQWVLTFLAAMMAGPSQAFSEDLCWSYVDPETQTGPIIPKPFNCWDLQCKDQPAANSAAGSCARQGLETYIDAAVLETLHARNSLHFDTVYLLARMLGMSLADARKLAVYDEATDFGAYRHYDASGQSVLASSEDILGVRRTNLPTNGYWLHFVPWYRGNGTSTTSVLGYTPGTGAASPFPAQERPLSHLRAWAFGQQSELCEFGLTEGSGSLGACLGGSGGKTLYYDMPLLAGPQDVVDARIAQSTPVSWQRVKRSTGAGSECTDRDTCFDRSFSGKSRSIEALGIYLHSLGDRLSHHFCSEGAAISTTWMGEGTPSNSADFYLFYPDICGTVAHIMLHYPETGQEEVPERSTEATRLAAHEIAQWLAATGYAAASPAAPRPGFPVVTNTEAVVALISRAIAKGPAADRLAALCNIARAGYGLEWHDGNINCQYQAGDPVAAATNAPSVVAEYFNSGLNHYFITASTGEKQFVSSGGAGPGWQVTGERFKAGGTAPVCRFYGNGNTNPATGQPYGPNSHFYTINVDECAAVKLDQGWVFETGDAFRLTPLVATEQCPDGTTPIHRVYNMRFAQNDSNHRYLTDLVLYQSMQAQGWRAEGMVFCAARPRPPMW